MRKRNGFQSKMNIKYTYSVHIPCTDRHSLYSWVQIIPTRYIRYANKPIIACAVYYLIGGKKREFFGRAVSPLCSAWSFLRGFSIWVSICLSRITCFLMFCTSFSVVPVEGSVGASLSASSLFILSAVSFQTFSVIIIKQDDGVIYTVNK